MAPAPQAYLSREVGQPVLSADGVRLGRVVDLTVRLDDERHPVVRRVGIGAGRRIRYLVPWELVTGTEARPTLALDGDQMPAYRTGDTVSLEEGELLLCRDVLDTQVVDLAGVRLSRVSDVLVVHRPDGRVEVAAVDVGLGSLLRRMGLRRVGAHLAPVAVDWADLHLTSSRGHIVQLSTSTTGFRRLGAHGLSELLARLSTPQATDLIRSVGPARSAEALRVSHPLLRGRLLRYGAPRAEGVPRRRLLRTAGWRIHRPPGADRTGPTAGERR